MECDSEYQRTSSSATDSIGATPDGNVESAGSLELSSGSVDLLADTRVFLKDNLKSPMKASLKEVHFAGYTIHEKSQISFQLMNASLKPQRYHLLPPQTKEFSVKVKNRLGGVVPGMYDTVYVDFKASEYKPCYTDCLRVHCEGEHNLAIPLLAYPIPGVALPTHIDFGACSVLDERHTTVNLTNSSECTFEFELDLKSEHRCFTVSPLQGTLPPQESVTVNVKYAPTDYVTSSANLCLMVNQKFFKQRQCKLLGSSLPGLPATHGV